MRALQRLVVSAIALALTSCTAYVQPDGHHAHRAYDPSAPCTRYASGGVIGLSIGRAEGVTRGPIDVLDVVADSPAGLANIQRGDRIRTIDGESTRGMTLSEAARLIRGRPGTAVELRIDSPRGARLITLIRGTYVHEHHGHGRRGHHGECGRCRDGRPCVHGSASPPPPPPPVDNDPSLAPQEWPPTKPGHPN
jgi:hypothetical protein